MKKIVFFLLCLAVVSAASAQTKISEMPTMTGNPNGGYVPIVISGLNKKVDPKYFGYKKIDSAIVVNDSTIRFYRQDVNFDIVLKGANNGNNIEDLYFKNDSLFLQTASGTFTAFQEFCPPSFAGVEGYLEENLNAQASLEAKQDVIPYGNNPDLIVDTFERYWNGYHKFPRLDSGIYNAFGIVQSTLGGNPYYTWQANSNMLLSRANIANLDSINYIGGQFFYGGGTLGTKPTSNSNGIVLSFGQNVNNLINTTNQDYQWSVDGNGAFSARVAPAGTGVWGAWVRPIYSVDLTHYLYDTGATVLGRLNAQSLRVGDAVTPTTTFNVVNTNTATLRGASLYQYSTGTNSSQLNMLKYRGTVASPTTIVTGDVLSNIMTWGYDGTNPVNAGSIRTSSIGTIGTGIVPSTMDFRTMTAAGVLTTALNLDQAQKATFTSDVSIGGNVLASGTFNKVTITAPTTGSTLRVRDGKTLDIVNTVTFSGTDGSTLAYRTGGTVIYATDVMTSTVGGLTPTPPNDATKFLSGAGTYILPFTSANVGNGLKLDSAKVKWGGTMYENMVLDANQKNVSIVNIGSGTWQSSDGTNASSLITNTGYAGLSSYDVNNLTTFTVGNTDVGGVNGAQMSASNISGTKNMVMTLFDSLLAIKYVVSSSPTSIFKMSNTGVITLATWQGVAVADAYIASSTNWNSAYSDRLKWDGGSTGLTASTGRTSLGGTTVGQNFFTLTNPSAIRFPRINADNTVDALSASDFLTAIGGGGGGSVTPAALTKTDDTNVTLTLGGTPSTALLQATSLTLGWTGTLADGRIASAATWNAKAGSGANTDITSLLLNQTGLVVKGGSSNALTIKPNETLTAGRTLNIITGDANRTLTLTGNATESGTNTGDQTISVTGDGTASGSTGSLNLTVTKLNGQSLAALSTGLIKNITSTGVPVIATSGTDYEVPLTFSTGLTRSTNTITVNTTQNIAKLSNLSTNGFVKTSSSDGTLSVDATVITSGTTYSSHTHLVNNTGSTAALVETPYFQEKNVTYAGTATWDGTAPTTPTITYDLFRDGMLVTLIIHGDYTGAGATNTTLTLTLPSDAPAPSSPTGRTSASNRQYAGFGGFSTAKTANWAVNNKAWLQLNGSSVPVVTVVGNSTSAASFDVTIIYTTDLPS